MSQYNNVSKDKYVLYKKFIACVTGNFYFANNNILQMYMLFYNCIKWQSSGNNVFQD